MRADQVTVRRLGGGGVGETDRVMRTAFGTHLGLAEPSAFGGDSELVRTRSQAWHTSAFVTETDGRIVGSSFVTRWGAFELSGPLTVDPSFWDVEIGGRLMGRVTEDLDAWGSDWPGCSPSPTAPSTSVCTTGTASTRVRSPR